MAGKMDLHSPFTISTLRTFAEKFIQLSSSHRHEDTEEDRQRKLLRETAQETRTELERLLNDLRTTYRATDSKKVTFKTPWLISPRDCPLFPSPATIKVTNCDTLNAAIEACKYAKLISARQNPLIVNFASHRKPGGGWLSGAMAQEESICYRSSLGLSLDADDYPLGLEEAIYSPYVLVMRGDVESGHKLLSPALRPSDLPVVSAVTIAALHQPATEKIMEDRPNKRQCSHGPFCARSPSPSLPFHRGSNERFKRDKDRHLTKCKMRLVLRIAAFHKHKLLILGALGCGVYANPPAAIAHCWLEVLKEPEFHGNWREVCFAVYDPKNNGNFKVFHEILHGKKV